MTLALHTSVQVSQFSCQDGQILENADACLRGLIVWTLHRGASEDAKMTAGC